MSNLRLAFLLPLFAGLVACSSGDSGGGDDPAPDPTPGDGGTDQAPIALDFTSEPSGNPIEDLRWTYKLSTSALLSQFITFELINAPTGMKIVTNDEGKPEVRWTPTDEHGDEVTVTVRATYDDGTDVLTREQTFVLQVEHVNDKPLIISTAPASAILGGWFNYQVEVADSDDENNGTDITFSASLPFVLEASRDKYKLEVSPTGLVSLFIPQDFLNDIDTDKLGIEKVLVVSVSVTDGEEDWRSLLNVPSRQQWNLLVVDGNLPPEIISEPVTTATEDVQYQYRVQARDIAGQNDLGFDIDDDLSFTLTDAPQDMTISATGLIEWVPAKQGAEPYSENVTVMVTDGGEDGAQPAIQSFIIDVTPVNDAPVLDGTPVSFVDAGATYSYQLEVSDPDDENNGTDLNFTLTSAPAGMTVSETGLILWTPDVQTGIFPVEVVVNDEGEDGASLSWTVEVRPTENAAPVISQDSAAIATSEDANGSTLLTASDANGDSLNWSISSEAGSGTATVVDGTVSYTPDLNFNGNDSFTVEVTDGSLSDTIVVDVSVSAVNDKPEIVSERPTTATRGAWFEYQIEVNDPDDENNGSDLIFTASLPLVSNANKEQYSLTVSNDGLVRLFVPSSYSFNILQVRVVVTDGEEDWKTAFVTAPSQSWALTIVEVNTNTAPVITSSPVTVATEDALYNYQVVAEDNVGETEAGDPIPDELTYSLVDAPEGMTISDIGLIEWTPTENGPESYSVDVTVGVADGGENDVEPVEQAFSIDVTPVNDAPSIDVTPLGLAVVGEAYSYQLQVTDVDDANNGTDLTFSLLSAPVGMTVSSTGLIEWTPNIVNTSVSAEVQVADNGEDGAAPASVSWTINVRPDNYAPEITQGESVELTTNEDTLVSTTLSATDADLDDLAWSVLTAATNGVASVNTQGVVEYTPNSDFNSTDTFEITVTDGSLSDAIEVNVTVNAVNDAPVIISEAVTAATEAQNYTYTATATDVENDVLVWSLAASPEGMTIDSASGEISWTPAGDNASEAITVVVDDGTDTTEQSFVVAVSLINDAPVITEGDSIELSANEETATTLELNATDIDSPAANLVWSIETQASSGVAVISGSGETQVATYTPSADFTGSDTFVVTITDGDLSDSITVNVTVADINDAPVITEGTTVALVTTEDIATNLTLNALDIDSDLANLSWSIMTAAANGTAEASGSGASQAVSYSPALNFFGNDSFVVQVSDGELFDTILVTVSVGAVNDAPVITSTEVVTATEDTAYIYPVLVNDVDSEEFVFSLSDKPEGMTIDETSGVIRWTPLDGVTLANVTIDVSDGLASGFQTFIINVTPVNDAPEITSGAVTSATEGELYTYAPTATDIDSEVLSWSLSQKPDSMVIDVETGVISWTPANGVTSAVITLVVSDGELSVTQMFTITVGGVNDAPVITEGATTAISTSEDTAQTLILNATDADNSAAELTWSILTPATKGVAEVSGTGNSQTVTYTPTADLNGSDSFTVQVFDGLATDTILVNVAVAEVNDAPLITSNAIVSAIEDTVYTYAVIASDADGDTLAYELAQAPEGMSIDANGVINWIPANGVTTAEVEVNVSDASETATQSFTINVSATNDAPVFTSEPVTTATEDQTYNYTAVATDADGNVLNYNLIDFPAGMAINTASGVITWTPADGVSSATITVTASDGIETVEQSFTVNVTPVNDAPIISEGESADLTTLEDTEGSITLNATDIDSATLTWSIETAANDGEAVVSGTGESQTVSYIPNADFNGVDTFVVEVSDGTDSDLITVNVTVDEANDAPIITSDAVTTATEDEAYSYTVTATDIDEDTLTFSLVSVLEGMNIDADTGVITWTPANGVTSESVTVEVTDTQLTDTQTFTIEVTAVNDAPEITSTPVTVATEEVEYTYTVVADDIDGDTLEFSLTASPEGMVIDSVTGVITWTPANGVTLEDVTVEVTDGSETVSQSFAITVSGVNDAPVITEETASITTAEDTEGTVTLNATDVDGDTINWSISGPAANGVATVSGSGTSQVIRYTPNADFNGVDTFTVEITDGPATDSIDVSVTVSAVNDSPVFANAASTSAVEGSLYQYTPVVTDVDDVKNGTDLTFTLVTGPEGMTVSATGVVAWTPPNGVSEANVTLQVADGGEDASIADSQSWTIVVGDVNDAPSITSSAPTTATEDVQYQYQVQVTDPDDANNGTDLTFTLTSAPDGMTVSSMGLIQWTPENLVTTAQVEVQVADGGESGVLPVTQSWTITVAQVNDAPEIASDAITSATEDEAYTYAVVATDIDGDSLSFSLDVAPQGMVISTDGVITWTPANGVDIESVIVAVFDGTVSTTQEFVIDVSAVNDAPVITSAANESATEDETYSYVVTAEDIDGDDLTFSLTTKPAGMTIDANSGVISWTPANNVSSEMVTVQVSDGVLTASQTFTIEVTAVNDAPEITSSPVTVATEDTEYNYTVVAADVDSDSLTFSLTEFPEGMVIDAATGVISWTPENGVTEETVTVEVTDNIEIASQTFVIIVSATNDAPEITEGETATLTTVEDIATSLTLNATDIDGDDLSWLISSAATNGEAVVSGTGISQTIEYTPIANFNGPDSFTVQVSDGVASDTILVSVTVEAVNDAPVITSAPITGATEGLEYTYTVQADDVDTDTLRFSLNASPEGMTIHPASGVITWTPANDVEEGVVTVEVTDSQIAVTQEFTITVRAVNDAPAIDSAPITVATEDEAYSYTVTATDIDGDTLAYSLTTFPAGMAIDAATGVISWTPANGVTSESVTVEVTDGQVTDSQTFTILVTAVNDAPEITEVSATIDTDEDNTGSVTLNATDVDGDTITWSIIANGTNGSAVVNGTGASQTVNYTPNANFNGSDSFTVQVSDNQATDTLVVNVTVVAANDAPEVTSTAVTTATEDEAYGYTVTASDVDGDTLEFSLTVAPEGMSIDSASGAITWTPANGVTTELVTVQVSDSQATATQTFTINVTPVNDAPTITSSPITGATEAVEYTYTVVANDIDGDSLTFSLSANPAGMVIDSASGVITWTPANGVDEGVVTVEVSDGQATATQSFTITVGAVNDAPVITEGNLTRIATGEDTDVDVTLNVTDADGDVITWIISGAASNGSATVSGTGTSQTVNYTPNTNFNGSDSFTVQVSDGVLTDTILVEVTVISVADAPVITEGETSAQSTNEDTSSAFALNATDVDGGTLTWTISSAASNGVATVSGTGVSQTVNYVPDANFHGTDTFVVQISDGFLTDSITITMTVVAVNDLPVITSEAVTTATEGQVYTYLPAATDVENDTLTWNVGTAPASMNVNSTTGELTWTPANGDASAPVTLIVNDGTGSVTQSFTITVTAVNDAPVITEGESTTVTMDEDATPQAFSLVLNAADADNAASELTWSIGSAATNGSATVSGTGTSKVVNYTPDADFNGADSFTVNVSDATASDTITVNVTVDAANDAPAITETSAAITTDEDVAGSVTLNATDIDTDAASITWTILTQATNGTASVSASNTGASMLVIYAPNANTNGADSFVVQISDGTLTDTITVDVTVNPVDDAPAIAQGDSVALTTNENTVGSVALNGVDIDTDAASLAWTVSTLATNGVANVTSTGANVSASYTPNTDFSGNDSFVVELSDGTSTDTITVNVTVNSVNAAPVITNGATATMTTDEDNQVTLSLAATDSDGDSLTWSISSGASQGGVAVDANGLVTYVPALDINGTDNFTVQVSDSVLTDSIDVTVTINAVNDVPVITEGATSTLNVNEDETGSLTFNATDADNDSLTWSLSSGALNGIVTRNGSEFSYTPNIDFNGSDSFTVAVSDDTVSVTNVVTVTVAAVNDAPSVTSTAVTDATENQVYAYDVAASDVEGDAFTFALTTSPSGMQIDVNTGEIRWIPSAAGTETVVVSVSDASATGTQTFDIVVAAEPAVAGRAVKGVLANALVEAFVYDSYDTDTRDHVWSTLGTTTTDANGYFGFDLGTQTKPVRIRVTTNASTTMVCDAPSGCLLSPPAIFGESGAPAEGMILDTIVSGSDFAGAVAVTPMTHMAATWLQAFPQALDDNNVLLGHRRLAKLFGFNDETYVNQRAIDLTDSFEVSQALNDDEDRVRHAIFAASLQETAVVAGLSIDSVAENVGLIFGLLGGQMPLKSGVIDVSTLNLVDESQGLDENGDPILFTEISYTGFDTFIANAKTVGESINDGSLTTMINGFDVLVTDWTPELADPSDCLVIDDADLDRSACRNITTIGEATGFDQANFDRAVAPIDVVGEYLDSAKAAESGIDQVNRDLGWLYVTTDDQTNTANMVSAFSEVLGYGVTTAVCVPQLNTFPYLACDNPVPSETFTDISPTITKDNRFTNRCSLSDDESCELRVTGQAQGLTFNVTAVIPDIRYLLGGDGGFSPDNGLNMCYTGTISNATAQLTFDDFCLKLDVSGSKAELLDTFSDFSVFDYANTNKLTPALDALVAEINLEASFHNGLTLTSVKDDSIVFNMSNLDMGFILDREVINGTKVGPIFNIYAKTLSRTNPAGETLNSISGKDLFRLDINNDVSVLTSAKVENNIGLPPVVTENNIRIEGLGPLVNVLKDYALGLVSFTEDPDAEPGTTPPVVTAEQWEQILAEVEAGLVYGGTITSTIQENVVDESGSNVFQTYVVELTSDGSLFVSNLNDNAELNSETAAMQIYLSGATGYIYAGETLVATAHLGNSQDGMLLSFADGTQRSYTNANPSATSQLDSFLDFITILFPSADEGATTN